jgi:hypothetical protein
MQLHSELSPAIARTKKNFETYDTNAISIRIILQKSKGVSVSTESTYDERLNAYVNIPATG